MVVIRKHSYLHSSALARWLCHADLDCLPTIQTAYRDTEGANERQQLVNEFAQVLNDVCIDSIWKRTMPGRLRTSQKVLVDLFIRDFQGIEKPLSWLDMGGSDGSTAIDMIVALTTAFNDNVRIDTVICDRNLTLARYRFGVLTEYRTQEDRPVLVRMGPLGLRLPVSPRRFDWLSSLLASAYLAIGALRQHFRPDGTISLLTPVLSGLNDVSMMELDVRCYCQNLKDRFDFVRASNVLNRGVFTRKELTSAIANMKRYLHEGGRLLISRNDIGRQDETEHGSVWRKSNGRLVHEVDVGKGCEIAEFVK